MIYSMFRALVTCVKFIKEPTDAPGFINPIMLRGDHGQVSATHVELRCLCCMFLKVMLQILKAQEKRSGSFVMRTFSFVDEQPSVQV